MSSKTIDQEDSQNDVVYNPFEVEIHSLSLPACSPSVFSLVKNRTPEKCELEESFRWSIGQVAKLRPAKIDESSQHSTLDEWDAEKEGRAQKAIETFFLQNSICPSPWGGAMAFKHVTFSPNLASTAYFSKSNSSFNVYGNDEYAESLGRKDAWTQTELVIPKEVDLFKLLGQFFSFLEDQKNPKKNSEELNVSNDAKDLLSTSTLRRKLFTGSSPNRSNSPDKQSGIDSVQLPLSPLKFCTPEKQFQGKPGCTPSSVATFFSSSPISVKNCSISSSLIGQQPPVSPPVSPIPMEKQSSKVLPDRHVQEEMPIFNPSSPIPTNSELKSILKGSSCEHAYKQAFSVSMNSEDSINQSQDINMEAVNEKSIHTSNMQTSGVQYSVDETALNRSSECSSFFPSVLSHDTGYHTKSYQSEVGLLSDNNVELKEKMLHHWLCQSRCSQVMECESSEITSKNHVTRHPAQNNGPDSLLLSQSNWKPSIFSTPH